ncbi:amidohydrolase family protein [Pseudogemmatithrix spongiicola]|uniref:Amidohydrolase family protein n=1 Tax=Pseudogemmatithrix spongiicola TaxID=3062599 RepID=A0AA49JYQ1_9BACT|nr:amidohydrolase family protein [Gemmatimonadaceae bacterium 'strain 138']WKW14303.1 amidohydrolase family protein [Gemmatimonadaceae bacterium 'strain 318']
MKSMQRILGGAAAALALSATVAAAQVRMTVPPQSQPVVLRGATIHTVTNGTITNGSIVLDGGKIIAIGQNVEVPRGARIVDVSGKHIYPGLIDAYSAVGITEIGAVDVSNDINEIGDFNPNVRAEVAVNAESRHIGTTRSAGVLVAMTTPGGGVISGLTSAMSLEGWTWEEMSMKGAAALNVNWPDPNARPRRFGGGGPPGGFPGAGPRPAPKTYAEQVQELRDFFAEARAYRDARAANQQMRTDTRYAAMIPVLNREIPVVVAAEGVAQINDAITWAKEENVRLIIRGGRDAIHVADRLKAENVPVILTATMAAPNRDYEGYDGAYSTPAQLFRAGVKFAIAGESGGLYSNRLPWDAGVAVAFGLPEEEALKAVTINAAEMLGVSDKVGSLEVGKQATLLITTGTPLDMTTNIEQAYIQGREIDMNDIQKHFFRKYMEKIKQQQGNIAM